MGRIVVTNNPKWSNYLTNTSGEVGFEVCKCDKLREITLTSFYKLNIKNTNYYERGEEAVIVVGTFFYKGSFGEDALEKLFNDRNKRTIKEIRSDSFGAYAVFMKLKDSLYVFTDETHMYGLYYYADNDNFLITNTYLHIQQCVSQKLDYDALLERGVRGGISGLNTPFKNIYSLGARQCIVVNKDSNEVKIKELELNDYKVSVSSPEDAIALIWERAQKVASIRSKYIRSYLQFVTGGIDSRLELAINIYNNDKVRLGYWTGDDVITNGTPQDLEIEKEIGEKFELEYDCYQVGEKYEDVLNKLSKKDIYKYGEYASKYAGNKKWFSIFENAKEQFIGFGYLGELLRELGELDKNYHEGYELDEFIRDVYCRTGLEKTIFSYETFYPYLSKQMRKLLNVRMRNDSMCDIDDYYRIFSYSRFTADCLLTNICNMYAYSFSVFGVKQVADVLFSTPYIFRRNEILSIGLTSRWSEELLDIPYYSHHHKVVCDKELLMVNETKSNSVISRLKPTIQKTKLYDLLYLRFLQRYIRPQQKNNKEVFEICMRNILNSEVFKESSMGICEPNNWKGAELATLASFVADIKCIELVMFGD